MEQKELEEELLDFKETEEEKSEELSGCPRGYCKKNLLNHLTAK